MGALNPFDLPGPAFLLFYLILALLLNGWFAMWVRRVDDSRLLDAAAFALLRDPYMLAYLRGGAVELVRLAVFGLTERQLLKESGREVKVSGSGSSAAASNALERQIIAACQRATKLESLTSSSSLLSAARTYALPLARHGLTMSQEDYRRRRPTALLVGGVLFGVAAIKILVALARGRHNIAFLVILTVIALILFAITLRFHRTPSGNQALRHQQSLLGHLKRRLGRLTTKGATNEAIVVAAAFGLTILPEGSFPLAHSLVRRPPSDSSGSSCSSGSGCGGGCGGGGCGGCGS